MTANMKPWLVIQELGRNNSKNFKQAVIETEAFASNDDLFEGYGEIMRFSSRVECTTYISQAK